MGFKIKTTVPTKYGVKPNFGTIEPGDKVIIKLVLLPNEYCPLERIKHRFLVQYVIFNDAGDFEKMWKECNRTLIREKKLRCIFNNKSNMTLPTITLGDNMEFQSIYGSEIRQRSTGDDRLVLEEFKNENIDMLSEINNLKEEKKELERELECLKSHTFEDKLDQEIITKVNNSIMTQTGDILLETTHKEEHSKTIPVSKLRSFVKYIFGAFLCVFIFSSGVLLEKCFDIL